MAEKELQQEHGASLEARKRRDDRSSEHRKPKERTRSGTRLDNLKVHPHRYTSSNKTAPPEGAITFPNSAADWGPSVQGYEPVEDFSHSNCNTGRNYKENGGRWDLTEELNHEQ